MGDSFSPVAHGGLKEREAAIMASLQLRLDCAGVSLQRLCMLDRITVLFNSGKCNSGNPPITQENPALLSQWIVSLKRCILPYLKATLVGGERHAGTSTQFSGTFAGLQVEVCRFSARVGLGLRMQIAPAQPQRTMLWQVKSCRKI